MKQKKLSLDVMRDIAEEYEYFASSNCEISEQCKELAAKYRAVISSLEKHGYK